MRIRDLGTLEIETGLGSARVSGSKQIAILSMLCLRLGTRVSIDELIEAGWGADARVADSTIENHIWRLRRTIEPNRDEQTCLLNEAGGYRLDLTPESVDSARFEQFADLAREAAQRAAYADELRYCDDALALWRGVPFEILSSAISTRGDIARLNELNAQLKEWRVDALLATGDTERAVLDLERLTTGDPFRERLWVQWMTALSRLGRNDDALQVFQRIRALLRDELGLEPGAELRELQRAIISQGDDFDGAQTTPPSGFSSVLPTSLAEFETPATSQPTEGSAALTKPRWLTPRWPMVGFQSQLSELAPVFSSAASGAVIRGPAGVGKTRFLDEALAVAHQSGAHVLRVVATRSTSSIPLGAFAGVLPETVRSDNLFTLLHRSATALQEVAAGRPLVVGVDDAQLLDDPSAALILHLASSATARVIVSVGSKDPAPDAILSLDKDTGAIRIDLTDLDLLDTGSLVDVILGGPADPTVHRWAYRIGLGNALYTTELIRSARSEGSLVFDGAWWRLEAIPEVPGSLTEIVDAALTQLNDLEKRALEVLALGEPIRLEVLVSLTTLETVIALEEARLIEVSGSAAEEYVTVSHPLYSPVIRADLPTLRSRVVLKELIDACSALGDLAASERLRLCEWMIGVGDEPDVDLLVESARTALGSGAPELAKELAHRAAGKGAVVDAKLVSAKASILRHDYEGAEEQLRELEPDLRVPAQAIAYLELQSEVLHWGQSRPSDLRDMLDRAEQWWSSQEWHAELVPLRHRLEVFGRLLPAEHATDQEVSSGTGTGTGEAPGELSALIGGLFYSGQATAALAAARSIEVRSPVVELDEAIILALAARIALESGGDLAELEGRLTRQLEAGLDLDDPTSVGQAAYSLAELRLLQLRLPESADLLDVAERHLLRRDPVGLLPVVVAAQVITSHFLADETAMDAALVRCRNLTGPRPLAHQLPYTARAEAWAAMHRGDRGSGQQLLLDAATELGGSPIHLARLTYEAMRLGAAAANVVPVLQDASKRSDSELVRLYAAHARARAEDDSAALRKVAEDFLRLGAVLYSSEVVEDVSDAVGRSART